MLRHAHDSVHWSVSLCICVLCSSLFSFTPENSDLYVKKCLFRVYTPCIFHVYSCTFRAYTLMPLCNCVSFHEIGKRRQQPISNASARVNPNQLRNDCIYNCLQQLLPMIADLEHVCLNTYRLPLPFPPCLKCPENSAMARTPKPLQVTTFFDA